MLRESFPPCRWDINNCRKGCCTHCAFTLHADEACSTWSTSSDGASTSSIIAASHDKQPSLWSTVVLAGHAPTFVSSVFSHCVHIVQLMTGAASYSSVRHVGLDSLMLHTPDENRKASWADSASTFAEGSWVLCPAMTARSIHQLS